MAPGGVDPSGLAVYAKKRVTVIDMSGLTNVVFTQINTMMGGITLNNATRCALQNGRHLYSNHFYLMPSGRGDAVLGTTRDDLAGAAVYVSGESNRIEGCEIAYAATGLRLDGRNHVVRNCVITDNYIGSYFSGIFIGDFYPVGGECGGHLIERNTISRTSRGAVYWNEHKNGEAIKTTYTKCRVLYNHISDFMENTEDGGAVYAWCVWANGTEVAYNWLHGEHGGYSFNPALYADDVTADFRYHHNVIWDVKLGIGWNKPRGGHEAYNNTIWGRDDSVKLTVNSEGCKVYNNLSNRYFKDTSNSEMKNNLTSGGFVGNPDKPTSGLDFRLASNSPAINAGVVVPGVTDGAIGAPDVGAYEFGGPAWIPGAGTEPVAPAAPADLTVTALSSHLIKLGWTDLAQNETAYTVERSTDGKIWTLLATLPADSFAYADAGFHLKAGTAYQYRVAATNNFGRSSYVSASVTIPQAVKAPVITSPLTAIGYQGVAFAYPITAANDPAEVTVEGLSKGLALVTDVHSSGGRQSLSTGVALAKPVAAAAPRDWRPPVSSIEPGAAMITGYPEEVGEAKIKLTATNAKGTDTKTLVLTIAKPAPLQIIGGLVSEYADLPAPPASGGQAGAAGVRWTVFTFTNNGSFTVAGGPVEYLIVAGGGGGSIHNDGGGAGGAGGFVTGTVTLARGTYAVQVGAGGAGSTAAGEGVGARGSDSYVTNTAGGLALLRAYGGGAGASWGNAGDGGSGGGGGVNSSGSAGCGWSGYFVGTQWVPRQGYNGGRDSGSGGGAGGPGADKINGGIQEGGPGLISALRTGTVVTYATGGKSRRTQGSGDDGAPNTGDGGGSGARINGSGYRGGNGGSGIVIVRFMRTGK